MYFKKVLVTGASGQLGKCIQKIVEEFPRNKFKFVFKSFEELDITDSEAVFNLFNAENFAFCINCAAYTNVDKAESNIEKAKLVNVQGVENLASTCHANNTILIHISTDFVFDGDSTNPYKETDEFNPLAIYGTTKLSGERIITQVLKRYFIIRTSWLYSEYGHNFMKTMLRLAEERDELAVVNDQKGTPTYAMDLADFILKIVYGESQSFGVYHYSNNGETTWYGFAAAIFELSKIQITLNPISTSEFPTPAKRPKYSVLDTSKTQDIFAVEFPDWKESLKRALKANSMRQV